MPTEGRSSSPRRERYDQKTLRPLYNLLFVLPLLVVFHGGALYYRTDLLAPRDLGKLLNYLGATAAYLPAALIAAVLLAQCLAHRGGGKFQGGVLLGMAGESVLWAAPLVATYYITEMLLAAGTAPDRRLVVQELLQCLGAGIYEEFIFRLAFISVAALAFVDALDLPNAPVAVVAILVSAVLFSLYHFSARQFTGELAFPWREFLFRAAAGAYLGGLYVVRGFGIAVGAHAAYNIYAFLSAMGH